MTTEVKIMARCGADTQVFVDITDFKGPIENFILQDGEEAIRHVYDDRMICVFEDKK